MKPYEGFAASNLFLCKVLLDNPKIQPKYLPGKEYFVRFVLLTGTTMSISNAQKVITETLLRWDGLSTAPHRFGGVEYRLGTRELGHIHGDHLVDIPFPKKVRDEIVKAGLAEPHHILPETGWISFYLRQEEDVQNAVALLRRSYEIALRQKGLR